MSVRNQQSDTSRVVKNPLLSAVPHSIDDFVNSSILCPAAEIPPTPIETETNDAKKSVIYGSEPAILDSDKFSEISLDQNVDSEPTTYAQSQYVYNPLQNLEPFGSAQLDNRDESTFNPIAQAAALKESLSQLPGVASSVLSSFSSILKGTASSSPQPTTPRNEPISDSYDTSPVVDPYQYPYYNYDQTNPPVEGVAAAPPTFYSPTDSAILQPPSSVPPTDVPPSNTYRLKERKKIAYAPIPGFSGNPGQLSSSPAPAPLPVQSVPTVQSSQFAQPTPIDTNLIPVKSNNSFSLTSFFSSPLIDKIQNTVLPPSRPVEQPVYQQPFNPIDISVQHTQPEQTSASVNRAPPHFFNPQAFNTQPFAPKPNESQPPAGVSTFTPATSTPHIFTPSVVTADTPIVPLFTPQATSNVPFPSQPLSQPQQQLQPFPPTAPPLSRPPSASQSPAPPPSTTPNQTNYQPIAQNIVPTPTLPVVSSVPPSVVPPQFSSGYRLKGKPLYCKPPPQASYHTVPTQVQPLQQPVGNLFGAQTAAAPSIPSVNIFNPFAANTTETSVQPESALQTGQPAPPVTVFNPLPPNQSNTAGSQPDAPIVTSTPQSSPKPSDPVTSENSNTNQFVPPQTLSPPPPRAVNATSPPPPPTSSLPSSHNQYRISASKPPSGTSTLFAAPNPSSVNIFNPVASSEAAPSPQQVQLFGVTPPPASSPQPNTVADLPSTQSNLAPLLPPSQPTSFVPGIFNSVVPKEVAPAPQQVQLFGATPPPASSPQPLAPPSQPTSFVPSIFSPGAPSDVAPAPQQVQLFGVTPPPASSPQPLAPPSQPTSFLPSIFHPIVPSEVVSEPQQVQLFGVTPPPTSTSQPNTVADLSSTQLNLAPFPPSSQPTSFVPSIFNPPTAPQHQFGVNPFGVQPLNTQATPAQLTSFFAPQPNTEQEIYPAKTPSPQPRTVPQPIPTPPRPASQSNNVNLFNPFEANASQSQDFNPFRTQQTIESTFDNLSLDSDNNNTSAVDNTPIEEPATQEALQPETNTYDPNAFFNNNYAEDTQASITSSSSSEFQIQNFFNNPPPLTETLGVEQDKNFNFIGTTLTNKRLEKITAAAKANAENSETVSLSSYIVEPASSAQSEFSEYAEPAPSAPQPELPQPSNELISRSVDRIFSSAVAATVAAAIANQDQQNQVVTTNNFNLSSETSEVDGNMPNATIGELGTSVTTAATNVVYRPVYKHWFYIKLSEKKLIWLPFTFNDSMRLEDAFTNGAPEVVTTDGGRCDVNIRTRKRKAVYWNSEETEVRRCSWFYKGKDSRYKPYDENVAEQLEEEYRDASNSGEWQRKIPLTSGETVVFHGPSTIVHFLQSQSPDSWAQNAQSGGAIRPRTVKRGIDEFTIEDGEPEQIDHLLFMVHGIGAACDLRFRSIQEVVDDFRSNALQLIQGHYRDSCDKGEIGRVEVLPISWHSELHSEDTGIDEKLKAITLESIPKLRNLTNTTLLDILFYTSPVFCQQIMSAVSGNMNDIYTAFRKRNPSFRGGVSVCGHSLGSLILFDLLQNQKPPRLPVIETPNADKSRSELTPSPTRPPLKRTISQQVNYQIGHAGTGQPFISYPRLEFQPKMFFALGSPIGMFVTVRGLDSLGLDFSLPTTDHFFNIFHPFDPVAYRIEALINPELASLRPVLIPHHKGRKRMHLELRETMSRFGAELKNKITDTFKATLNTVYNYATLNKSPKESKAIQTQVDMTIEKQLSFEADILPDSPTNSNLTFTSNESENGDTELPLGKLNRGRRIDHVLQEAPMEYFNEYLFALSSHVCYWESSDTTLFIMKEIYSSQGIRADMKLPPPTMTIERPTTSGFESPTS